jgi:3-hydroxy acid dehydrogenase/malonic semialdehyde reductase
MEQRSLFENRVEDKHVLITGATAGIGKATAEIFAAAGAKLSITGRREERLRELAADLSDAYGVAVTTGAFDLRDRDACKDFVDSLLDPVDILVNNAGLAKGVDPVYEGDFDDWDTMIDTNVKGLLTMSRLISEQMRERNEGHVINVGSIAGHEAYAGGVVYAATKHAVKAITEATKKDLHGTNVRVSMVSPGLVETEFSNVRFYGDDEKADQVYQGFKPLTGPDIAEVIFFMANRPAHVNIMDSIVFPTAQSAATMVDKG